VIGRPFLTRRNPGTGTIRTGLGLFSGASDRSEVVFYGGFMACHPERSFRYIARSTLRTGQWWHAESRVNRPKVKETEMPKMKTKSSLQKAFKGDGDRTHSWKPPGPGNSAMA